MEGRLFLSVIIPAWNEQACLAGSLDTVIRYLRKQEYTSEVVVVDDGSTDATTDVAHAFAAQHDGAPPLRVIENKHRGKGYAVRTGLLAGTGKYLLFTDADLSTPVYEIGKMVGALEMGADIAIGTRQGIGAERVDEPLVRSLLRRVFNLLVRLVSGLPYRDTQAGFKGFRREVAHDLFRRVQLYGEGAGEIEGHALTAFDVEVLYLATRAGYRIEEIPVRWEYDPQSRRIPLGDAARMLSDVIRVRWMAAHGAYETP
jgi:glycosyltransferase involved in cell wall biosynthesis